MMVSVALRLQIRGEHLIGHLCGSAAVKQLGRVVLDVSFVLLVLMNFQALEWDKIVLIPDLNYRIE